MGSSSTGPTNVRCSKCGKLWPSTVDVCPDDGVALEAFQPWLASNSSVDSLDGVTDLVVEPPFAGSHTDLAPRTAAANSVPLKILGSNVPSSLGAASGAKTGPAPVLPSGSRVGEYEIEGKIGEGAMGAVYRAVHPTIGKHVAVKIMNPRLSADTDAIDRFTNEARSLAAIRHPGIVDVFGFGTLDDGRSYLLMEWLDGTSLARRLQLGRLSFDGSLEILDQIARALDAAHDTGIIHRDLKPDNVFLERVAREKPIVRILDFGLAKLAVDEGAVSNTQPGQLVGTPRYMSPEQCRGDGVDFRTDIYALGCIAYELILGRVPFPTSHITEVIAAHLAEPPPAPSSLWPDISPELETVLVKMLAKNPAERPQLQELRQTIAAIRGIRMTTHFPVATPRSHRKWVLAVCGVAAAIAVGVAFAARRNSAAPTTEHSAVVSPPSQPTDAASPVTTPVDAAAPAPVATVKASPVAPAKPAKRRHIERKAVKKGDERAPAGSGKGDERAPADSGSAVPRFNRED